MPSVSTSFVLARPGTPTRRPWPPASRVIEGQIDDVFLAEDDRVNGLPGAPDGLKRRLRITDDRVVQGGGRLSNAGRHEVTLPLIPNSPSR